MTPPIHVLGVDPSFSATGLAYVRHSEHFAQWKLPAYPMSVESAGCIADEIANDVAEHGIQLVAIETPNIPRNSSGDIVIGLAGLGWIIRDRLWRNVYVVDISATDRMLWATGKGSGVDKPDVQAGAVKLGFKPDKPKDFDRADAFILADIARSAYDLSMSRLGWPYHQRVVLGRLNWPRIGDIKPEFLPLLMPKTAADKRAAALLGWTP